MGCKSHGHLDKHVGAVVCCTTMLPTLGFTEDWNIAGEAGQLLREISALSENSVLRREVSMEALEAETAENT